MRRPHLLVLALCAAVAACGERNENPVKTSTPSVLDAKPAENATPVAGTTTAGVATTVPDARPDRDTPPAMTPATHSGTPQPATEAKAGEAAAGKDVAAANASAPTARDSATRSPAGDLTVAEEQKSMPKPGQTNNFMSLAVDEEKKRPADAKAGAATSPAGGTGSASANASAPATAASPTPGTAAGTTDARTGAAKAAPASNAAASSNADTARDSRASQAKDALTRKEESQAMPMPGQTNNFMSPALDARQTSPTPRANPDVAAPNVANAERPAGNAGTSSLPPPAQRSTISPPKN